MIEDAKANQQKPSAISAKESIIRVHLVPLLGDKRLNEITTEDVQRTKTALSARSSKTVNNVLTVLHGLVRRVSRHAHVKGGVHILRHTFCSHLAMRGAPARAIQELAGHQDIRTTMRYMHLSPAAVESAIRLLDAGRSVGEIVEAAGTGA